MPVRPMLLHRMGLISFRLFCKNLGYLQEFFGQMVYRPPWPKIACTPMVTMTTNCVRPIPLIFIVFMNSVFLDIFLLIQFSTII